MTVVCYHCLARIDAQEPRFCSACGQAIDAELARKIEAGRQAVRALQEVEGLDAELRAMLERQLVAHVRQWTERGASPAESAAAPPPVAPPERRPPPPPPPSARAAAGRPASATPPPLPKAPRLAIPRKAPTRKRRAPAPSRWSEVWGKIGPAFTQNLLFALAAFLLTAGAVFSLTTAWTTMTGAQRLLSLFGGLEVFLAALLFAARGVRRLGELEDVERVLHLVAAMGLSLAGVAAALLVQESAVLGGGAAVVALGQAWFVLKRMGIARRLELPAESVGALLLGVAAPIAVAVARAVHPEAVATERAVQLVAAGCFAALIALGVRLGGPGRPTPRLAARGLPLFAAFAFVSLLSLELDAAMMRHWVPVGLLFSAAGLLCDARPFALRTTVSHATSLGLVGLAVAITGMLLTGPVSSMLLPAAASASWVALRTGLRHDRRSPFVVGLVLSAVVYFLLPAPVRALATALRDRFAESLGYRHEPLPLSYYGLSFLPYLAVLAGAERFAQRRGNAPFATCLRVWSLHVGGILAMLAISAGNDPRAPMLSLTGLGVLFVAVGSSLRRPSTFLAGVLALSGGLVAALDWSPYSRLACVGIVAGAVTAGVLVARWMRGRGEFGRAASAVLDTAGGLLLSGASIAAFGSSELWVPEDARSLWPLLLLAASWLLWAGPSRRPWALVPAAAAAAVGLGTFGGDAGAWELLAPLSSTRAAWLLAACSALVLLLELRARSAEAGERDALRLWSSLALFVMQLGMAPAFCAAWGGAVVFPESDSTIWLPSVELFDSPSPGLVSCAVFLAALVQLAGAVLFRKEGLGITGAFTLGLGGALAGTSAALFDSPLGALAGLAIAASLSSALARRAVLRPGTAPGLRSVEGVSLVLVTLPLVLLAAERVRAGLEALPFGETRVLLAASAAVFVLVLVPGPSDPGGYRSVLGSVAAGLLSVAVMDARQELQHLPIALLGATLLVQALPVGRPSWSAFYLVLALAFGVSAPFHSLGLIGVPLLALVVFRQEPELRSLLLLGGGFATLWFSVAADLDRSGVWVLGSLLLFFAAAVPAGRRRWLGLSPAATQLVAAVVVGTIGLCFLSNVLVLGEASRRLLDGVVQPVVLAGTGAALLVASRLLPPPGSGARSVVPIVAAATLSFVAAPLSYAVAWMGDDLPAGAGGGWAASMRTLVQPSFEMLALGLWLAARASREHRGERRGMAVVAYGLGIVGLALTAGDFGRLGMPLAFSVFALIPTLFVVRGRGRGGHIDVQVFAVVWSAASWLAHGAGAEARTRDVLSLLPYFGGIVLFLGLGCLGVGRWLEARSSRSPAADAGEWSQAAARRYHLLGMLVLILGCGVVLMDSFDVDAAPVGAGGLTCLLAGLAALVVVGFRWAWRTPGHPAGCAGPAGFVLSYLWLVQRSDWLDGLAGHHPTALLLVGLSWVLVGQWRAPAPVWSACGGLMFLPAMVRSLLEPGALAAGEMIVGSAVLAVCARGGRGPSAALSLAAGVLLNLGLTALWRSQGWFDPSLYAVPAGLTLWLGATVGRAQLGLVARQVLLVLGGLCVYGSLLVQIVRLGEPGHALGLLLFALLTLTAGVRRQRADWMILGAGITVFDVVAYLFSHEFERDFFGAALLVVSGACVLVAGAVISRNRRREAAKDEGPSEPDRED